MTAYKEFDTSIKIMIVDDSAVIRSILTKIISRDPQIEVLATASTAIIALEIVKTMDIDLVLLDIEMPGMKGVEAIPIFLKIKKDLKIIMVSNLTLKNAPVALQALSLGAADYIEKPSAIGKGSSSDFEKNLLDKIKNLINSSRDINSNINKDELVVVREIENFNINELDEEELILPRFLNTNNITLRKDRVLDFKPEVIAIASSTGGPKAVLELISGFNKEYLSTIPILLTQHMPSFFTGLFAKNIDNLGIVNCFEGEDGQELKAGNLYVAPGGKHMSVIEKNNKLIINITDGPEINFCKPSADPMFTSLSKIFRHKMLSIVLTGMGHDGLRGAKMVVKNNGVVIVQDKESSVIWGMPGNIAVSNICSAVLPLNRIAQYVMQRGK